MDKQERAKRADQDRLDREELERRQAAQAELAKTEAINYLRTHDAEAAAEHAALMATRTEQHQPEQEEE
jgi:hypothetical protein